MKHTLSEWQFFLIFINFIVGSALLKAPLMIATFAKQDAWLSMLLTMVIGIIIMCGGLFIYRRYNYAFVYDIVEQVLGRSVGTVVNVVIIFLAVHTSAMVLRNLSNFLTVIIPASNPWQFQLPVLLVCMYSLMYGVSNFGKVNEILSPIMFFFFVLSLLFIINRFSFDNFQPVLANGWKQVVHGSYTTLGFSYIQLFLLASMMTYVKRKQRLIRISLAAHTIGGLSLVTAIVCVIGVEGAHFAARATYPAYELMRGITDTPFFERVEALIGLIWVLAIFVKIIVGFFAAVAGVSYVARRDNYRPFLLPIGILIWAMSNALHPNIVDFTNMIMTNWTLYWLTGYVMLIGIFLFGIIRQKDRAFREMERVRTGIVSE